MASNETVVMEAPTNTPKGLGYNKNNNKRIEAEEAEIAELEKQMRGETTEETSETNEASEVEDKPLSREEKTFKKRYGDLRRHMDKTVSELKAENEALRKAGGSIHAPKSDEDIELWIQENPDVAAVVNAIAERKATEKFSDTKLSIDALNQEKADMAMERAERAIMKVHPDFEDIREDDAFHDWVEGQSQLIQNALYDNTDDPQAVITVLNLYKAETKTSKRKSPSKDASRETPARAATSPDAAKRVWKESVVDRMSMEDYAKHEEEIMKAMREGNFEYDLSGSR